MSYLSRGVQLSVIIHALVFGLIAMGGSITPVQHEILTIDFTVKDNCICAEASQETAPVGRKIDEKMAESTVSENSTAPAIKPEVIEEATALPPEISENQAAVAAREKRAEETDGVKDTRITNAVPAQTYVPPAAVASDNSATTREAVYIKESFSSIRDSVQKNASYPKIARKMGWQGKVLISFIVAADGIAREIKIVQSSGCELLDNSTVDAVKKALPFPKPPVQARLVVPVVYRLD